jgi:minor histocompatibility antigen H13
MSATEIAMHYSDHAQPALLYLVPGVLISLLLTATFRGELKVMWLYTEEEDEDQDVGGKNKDSTESKAEAKSVERKQRKSLFSFSRTTNTESKITGPVSALVKSPDSEEGDKQSVSPKERSVDKAESLEGEFRRDPERDIVFFSVGKADSWSSLSKISAEVGAKEEQQGEPKWVVPTQKHEEQGDMEGHAGKRLRTA